MENKIINVARFSSGQEEEKLFLITKSFKKVFIKSAIIYSVYFMLLTSNALAFDMSEIELTPEITVSETYDDNISYASAHELSDFITRINPGVTAEYDADEFRWDIYADVTQVMFARHNEFDNTSESVAFNGQLDLSKHDRLTLSEKFSHTYEPVSFDEAFGRTLGRYSYYTNNIVVEYIRDITSQCEAKVYYGHRSDQFAGHVAEDSYMNTAGAQIDYSLTSRTRVYAYDEFSKRTYEYGFDLSKNRAAAGIEQDITNQLSCTAEAGIDFISADSDYQKPLISLSLNDRIDESTDASLSYVQEYAISQYQQDCFDSWMTSAKLSRHPSPRIQYGCALFYGEGKYSNAAFHEQFIGNEIWLNYSINKNTDIIAAYTLAKVLSGDADREYTKNKILTGVRAKF